MPDKPWKFAVFVSSESSNTQCFGKVQNYEDAVELRRNALKGVGWKYATIFDASLREVTEPPKE